MIYVGDWTRVGFLSSVTSYHNKFEHEEKSTYDCCRFRDIENVILHFFFFKAVFKHCSFGWNEDFFVNEKTNLLIQGQMFRVDVQGAWLFLIWPAEPLPSIYSRIDLLQGYMLPYFYSFSNILLNCSIRHRSESVTCLAESSCALQALNSIKNSLCLCD